MPQMNKDPIMDRLRKLKARVDDARGREGQDKAAQNEVDNALNLLLTFAAKYQVDIALLENETMGNMAAHIRIRFKNPHAKDKGRLMSAIVNAYGGCSVILKDNVWHYFAYQSDLNLADKMFDLLFDNGLQELARARARSYETSRSFTTAFWAGYINTLYRRLDDARKGALSESKTGAELVLVNRGKDAEDLRGQTYKNLVKGPRRTIHSTDGYAAGRIAGENASLGVAEIG